jgi:hypothetical protein
MAVALRHYPASPDFAHARQQIRRGLVDAGTDHGGCADYSSEANPERQYSRQQKRSHAYFLRMVWFRARLAASRWD